MRVHKQRHKFYCGIDRHARKMYDFIIDSQGNPKLHQNLDTDLYDVHDIERFKTVQRFCSSNFFPSIPANFACDKQDSSPIMAY